MRFRNRQSGQAAVETAIVMPLNLFLILSILQYGLISQARYMAKYAAYRAARVGSMQHADHDKMVAAAEAALLPVIAMPGATGGIDVIEPTTDITSVGVKIANLKVRNAIGGAVGLSMVDVVICGPLKNDVSQITQSQVTGVGSNQEVDFDDPHATFDAASNVINPDDLNSSAGGDKLKKFEATKLRVQVQFMYWMPIPFANWAISRMYLGVMTGPSLRLGDGDPEWMLAAHEIGWAHEAGIYLAPIYESYAMRMQSNIYLDRANLKDKDECVTWGSGTDMKGNTRSP